MTDYGDQWWAINGQELFNIMQRVADGEVTPELAYLELVANSTVDPTTLPVDGEDDGGGDGDG